eukprot:g40142.t1
MLLALLVFLLTDCLAARVADFVPSTQWQELKEGQSVSPGLHIRVDLTTGKREARLIPPEDNHEDMAIVAQEKPEVPRHDFSNFTMPNPEEREEILKQLFSSTDLQLIKDFLAVVRNATSTPEQIHDSLLGLEDLVHQYDNAVDWVKLGGLVDVQGILKNSSDASDVQGILKNSSDAGIAASAAWLLGTAAQNNGDVQAAALKGQLITLVVKRLEASGREQADKQNSILQRRLLYAAGTLLRANQEQQLQFLLDGGSELLYQLLQPATAHSAREGLDYAVLNKVIILVGDLLADHIINLPAVLRREQQQQEQQQQQQEAPAEASDLSKVPGVGFHVETGWVWQRAVSSQPLFERLVSPPWCRLLHALLSGADVGLRQLPAADSDSASKQLVQELSLLEQLFKVVDLLQTKHEPPAKLTSEAGRYCTEEWEDMQSRLQALLQPLATLAGLDSHQRGYAQELVATAQRLSGANTPTAHYAQELQTTAQRL